MQELIYENYDEKNDAHYKLYINQADEYFYIDSSGDISFEFDKETNLRLLEEIEKYQYSNFIFNLTEQKSSAVKARIWFVSYVAKKAYKLLRGKKIRSVVISSSSPLENAVVGIVMRSVGRVIPNMEVKSFSPNSLEEAKDWIIKDGKKVSLVN